MPEAYERLLLDVMHGDASLFSRADEVELAWGIIDPIADGLAGIASAAAGNLRARRCGARPAPSEWMHRQGRQWFDTCPVLS